MRLFIVPMFLLSTCTLNHPSTGPGRTSPITTRTTAIRRDTLFARAFAAMRERGYTEITPDTTAQEVRGKSPQGTSVIVALHPTIGDSTRVDISASDNRQRIGMDQEALSTALTLMADVTRPTGVVNDPLPARLRTRPDSSMMPPRKP